MRWEPGEGFECWCDKAPPRLTDTPWLLWENRLKCARQEPGEQAMMAQAESGGAQTSRGGEK